MKGLSRNMRRGVAVLVLVMLMSALPAAVSADTPYSHSGKRGAHGLIDSPEFPGAWCDYNGLGKLFKVRVRWPHVEGYNHTSGSRDYQKVSWRFQLWRDAALYYTSPLSVDYTYDNEAAFWPSKSYSFPTTAPSGTYTIRVVMYWYYPSSTVNGNAVHLPDYILHVVTGMDFFSNDCEWQLP